MFDKLVESDTTGAEFKNRSRYFMVSSVVVGILFLTAVVYSLYAAEIGLGRGNFGVAELLAPVVATQPEPPDRHERPISNASSENRPIRRLLMEETATSTLIPIGPSVVPNPYRTISADRFKDVDRGPVDSEGSGLATVVTMCKINCTGTSASTVTEETGISETKPPPPAVREIPKPKPIVSEGVINGKATYLPVPEYSAAAKAVDAKGTVNVQVTIDEQGNVISAKAATGHPLLKPAAERAAKQAKFSPTYLSKVPVKVTGVIVYHFKRN